MNSVEMPRGVCGVYKITNLVNWKSYVGCSTDIKRRWMQYRVPSGLRVSNPLITRELRKYGLKQFSFAVLEECAEVKLSEREIWWIAILKPEYNLNTGGVSLRKVRVVNEVVSQKMSQSLHQQAKLLSAAMGIKLQEIVDRGVALMLHRHKNKLAKK